MGKSRTTTSRHFRGSSSSLSHRSPPIISQISPSRVQKRRGHSSIFKLLPTETLSRIFVFAQNPALSLVCRLFHNLSKDPVLHTHYLSFKYGLSGALSADSQKEHIFNLSIAKRLISLGANPRANNSESLASAAKRGDLKLCELLIKEGADFRASSGLALKVAALEGHLDIVKLLIKVGANVGIDESFAAAIEGGHDKIMKVLIDVGADWGNMHVTSSLTRLEEWADRTWLDYQGAKKQYKCSLNTYSKMEGAIETRDERGLRRWGRELRKLETRIQEAEKVDDAHEKVLDVLWRKQRVTEVLLKAIVARDREDEGDDA